MTISVSKEMQNTITQDCIWYHLFDGMAITVTREWTSNDYEMFGKFPRRSIKQLINLSAGLQTLSNTQIHWAPLNGDHVVNHSIYFILLKFHSVQTPNFAWFKMNVWCKVFLILWIFLLLCELVKWRDWGATWRL